MSDQRGRVRVERGSKRVRAYLAGRLVADTVAPLLVWEKSPTTRRTTSRKATCAQSSSTRARRPHTRRAAVTRTC